MAKDNINSSLGAFAAEFGLTRDVLRRIVSEAGVRPAGKRGGHPIYRLRDVYLAVIGQQQPENMNPHARLALARAIKTEDEIKARRRELVEVFEMERCVAELCKSLVQVLETSPDVLERDIGLSAKQAARLEQHFDDCRERLYREITGNENEEGNSHADGKPESGHPEGPAGTGRRSRSAGGLRAATSVKRRNKKAAVRSG